MMIKRISSSGKSHNYNSNLNGNNDAADTTTLAIIALILTGTAATSFSFITLKQLYWPTNMTKKKKDNTSSKYDDNDDDESESNKRITTTKKKKKKKKSVVIFETISSLSFITLKQLYYWPSTKTMTTKTTKKDTSTKYDDDDDDNDSDDSESKITTEKKKKTVVIEETVSSLEKELLPSTTTTSSSSSSYNNNYNNNYHNNNNNEPITDALTPLTIQILTATSNIVGSTKTANIFYHNLFTTSCTSSNNDLKGLFSTQNFAAQSLKFGQMMKWTTTTLQYLYLSSSTTTTRITNSSSNSYPDNNIIQSIKDLGYRHIKYGIKLKHFHPMKRALLDTIRELDFSSVSIDNPDSNHSFDDSQNNNQIGLDIDNTNTVEKHHHQPPLIPTTNEIVRAWESLIYVFVGYMGPILLQHSPNESLIDYRLALENDLAAPAGGTATAISASQGVALLKMSIKLTKKPDECVEKLQKGNYELKLQSIMESLQYLAQQDMEVYCRVMVAVRQPPLVLRGGNKNKQQRKQAIDDSLDLAVSIPLDVVKWSILALQIAIDILPLISKSGTGDAGAGCYMIIAAAKTGLQNIRINTTLPSSKSSQSLSSKNNNNPIKSSSSTSKSSIKQQRYQKQREELISNLILTLDWQEKELMNLLP